MKKNYIVGYDISDQRRLARVAKVMKSFGGRIQYSFFHCFISDSQKKKMLERLKKEIHQQEDQVVVIPVTERQLNEIECVGYKLNLQAEGIIIV